jgi:mRNA interferase HigB
MRIIARRTLVEFWERYPDSRSSLQAWFSEAKAAHWSSPSDVKARYITASILRNSRIVFNIGGNKYRLVVMVRYSQEIVYIRFVGTHSEYDRIDAEEI